MVIQDWGLQNPLYMWTTTEVSLTQYGYINMAKRKNKEKGNKICPAGIAWAKNFDKYPSAYANLAASKYAKILITQNHLKKK